MKLKMFLPSLFCFTLLSPVLPLCAEDQANSVVGEQTVTNEQKGVEIHLSEMELQEIFNNPTRSYVYVGPEVSKIADVMQEVAQLDDNQNSLVHGLVDHIAKGFNIGNYDAVAQALQEADLLIQKHAEALGQEKASALIRSLDAIIEQVVEERLNLDAELLSFLKNADATADASVTRNCHGLRLLVIKEKIDVLGKAKFRKDVTFYDDVTIQGTLSVADETVGCDITVGCNINMNNSTSALVGNVLKGGALFISNFGTNNTFVGVNSGNAAITGNSNVGVGSFALTDNIAGLANTAVGANALSFNLADDNTAVGFDALIANTTGTFNTGMGSQALAANTTGSENTAVGTVALLTNVTGVSNTAIGANALQLNTSDYNTAVGSSALNNNNIGTENTGIGHNALQQNTNGISNTAIGDGALLASTLGNFNIALGQDAGSLLTSGDNNIYIAHNGVATESDTTRIGTVGIQTTCFIAGIHGVTTGLTAVAALIDANGQLGTVSSSRKFKHGIENMNDASANIYKLRPVTFAYNGDDSDAMQYGLIAEEVDLVFPEIVAYDEYGQPYTVQYHVLPALILNELQKLAARVAVLEARS